MHKQLTIENDLVSSGSDVSTAVLDNKALTLIVSPELAAISFLSFCRAHILWAAPERRNMEKIYHIYLNTLHAG